MRRTHWVVRPGYAVSQMQGKKHMNERDKEFAKQAGFYLYDLMETHEIKTIETDSRDEWVTLQKLIDFIRSDERKACAELCDDEARQFERNSNGANDGRYDWKADGAHDCADAIRARGNT